MKELVRGIEIVPGLSGIAGLGPPGDAVRIEQRAFNHRLPPIVIGMRKRATIIRSKNTAMIVGKGIEVKGS
jgi:hypothetical protein